MFRKLFPTLAAGLMLGSIAAVFTACTDDDSYSLQYFYDRYGGEEEPDTPIVLSDTVAVAIVWNESGATVTGDTDSLTIKRGGTDSHVIIESSINRYLEITVSGQSSKGSLLVYGQRPWGVVLNGINLGNPDGPAINNQCSKWLYVTVADGSDNILEDGTEYAAAPKNALNVDIDQKAAFFSEGEILFKGTGKLTVNGNGKNGIASDDYIILEDGDINVNIASTGSNGIKVNDGMEIIGGLLNISVASQGGRGIKNDKYMRISGGETTIKTTGACRIETENGVRDTTTAAGIKCDSVFTMTAGQLTITSSGDGGKGINSGDSVKVSGGTLTVVTTGTNKQGKPKGVKSDKIVILSGGTFDSKVNKSKACDSGGDDTPTIVGTPVKRSLNDTKHIYVEF